MGANPEVVRKFFDQLEQVPSDLNIVNPISGEQASEQQQSPGQVMAGRRMWAPVAQMVEHLTHNQEVVGSMPAWVSLTFSSTV